MSVPAVLVTGPSVTQNSVSSLAVDKTIGTTRCAYPRTDGEAELAWMACLNAKTVYPRHGGLSQY